MLSLWLGAMWASLSLSFIAGFIADSDGWRQLNKTIAIIIVTLSFFLPVMPLGVNSAIMLIFLSTLKPYMKIIYVIITLIRLLL